MATIIGIDSWVNEWIKHKKIVHYPGTFYGLPENWASTKDYSWAENQMRKHLFEIKTLLLFFDICTSAINDLLFPTDPFTESVSIKFLNNHEINELLECGLLQSQIIANTDVLTILEENTEYIKKRKYIYKSDISTNFKSTFKMTLSERDSGAFNSINYHAIKSLVYGNFYRKDDIDALIGVLDKSVNYNGDDFSFTSFFSNMLKKNNPNYEALLKLSCINVYQACNDLSTAVPVPYSGYENYDNILRVDDKTNVYCYLYSSDFFIAFLKHFIPANLLINIYKITPEDLLFLRSEIQWSEYIENYHQLLKDISFDLEKVTANNIKDESLNLLDAHFLYKKQMSVFIHSFITSMDQLLFRGIFTSSRAFTDNYKTLEKRMALKNFYSPIYEFIKCIEKILQKKYSPIIERTM